MFLGLLLAILFLGLLSTASAVDYCDPALCATNNLKNHIGCRNSGAFDSICQEESMVTVTSQLQKAILFEHNDLRNKVANGTLPRFRSASRMTTMTWDSELEHLAKLNVLSCVLKHDDCHNTKAYKYSGQNLAIQYRNTVLSESDYEGIVKQLINEWFNENKDATQADVDNFSRNSLTRTIGHFTAMVQEKSAKVGCGISKFSKVITGKKWYAILMACNYSFTNMIDMPIYVKGAKCAACQTGCNPDFDGLCSISEYVPPITDTDEMPDNVPPVRPAARPGLTVPTVQRVPSARSVSRDPNLSRPTRPVPSARLMDLMRTAETVVRPFEPGQTFYIRDEPNPAIPHYEIVRPVPVVTWRGPRTAVAVIIKEIPWPFNRFTRM